MNGERWTETGVVAVIVTILVIIAAFIVGKAADFLSLTNAAIGGAIIFGLFAGVIFVSNKMTLHPLMSVWRKDAEEVSSKVNTLSIRIEALAAVSNADWLIKSDRLKELELAVLSDHIWIITQSLEEEIEDGNFGHVISKNISRGVSYTYFVPDTPLIRARVAKLKLLHPAPNGLQFRIVKNELFAIVTGQDVAIFGALDPKGGRMTGYMNLPIKEHGSDFFILLGPKHAEQYVAVLTAQPFEAL